MLLICPVRPGDSNEELRFALRSWETNLIQPGGLELMTVGHCPPWLSPDVHLPGNHYKSVPFAVFDNILIGSETAADMGAGEVLYMNDDFFCLDPVGSVLPVRRNMTLEAHVRTFGPSAINGNGLWWPRSLALTLSWLREAGFPHPESYEVHRPLLASPAAMFEALSRWDITSGDDVPQWRTVYGVLNAVEAYPVDDVKLSPKSPGVGSPWVSTSDQSWRRYAQSFTRRFQKPSRWELG